jgi:hypothetical protein
MSTKDYIISKLKEFVQTHKSILFKYDFDPEDAYHIIEVKGYELFETFDDYPEFVFDIKDYLDRNGEEESFYFIEYDSPLGCPSQGEIISYSHEIEPISYSSEHPLCISPITEDYTYYSEESFALAA